MVRIGISALRAWRRKTKITSETTSHLLEEGVAKRVDCRADELGAVVGRDELDAFGKAGLHGLEACLHGVDRGERVLAVAHHDDPADRLAVSVQLGDPTAHLRAEGHLADVAHE